MSCTAFASDGRAYSSSDWSLSKSFSLIWNAFTCSGLVVVESFSIRQASRSFFVVPFRLEFPTSSTCTLKPSFQDWFSCLILPAQLAIALNMAMMIPTPRIEPIDVEASRIGNNGPIATRRMDIANASMGQLGTDDGDQD